MSPLIEIKNIPIQIEMKISNAKLEHTKGTADLEISRGKDGIHIRSNPIRIAADSFEYHNYIMPVIDRHAADSPGQGSIQSTYSATAVQDGKQLLLRANVNNELMNQLAVNPDFKNVYASPVASASSQSQSLPTAQMSILFEMDKLNFDWHQDATHFEFTPGTIEFTVAQKPDVIITYLGGPIYVPPSFDPNYEPVDVQA